MFIWSPVEKSSGSHVKMFLNNNSKFLEYGSKKRESNLLRSCYALRMNALHCMHSRAVQTTAVYSSATVNIAMHSLQTNTVSGRTTVSCCSGPKLSTRIPAQILGATICPVRYALCR